ncbi:MAG TPA: hypothetical protein DCL35_01555 [Candidatus Omnitrophica bacterium]|nr:hypothetical protein [Candidatus Omnitrophota bacterium]
MQINKKLQLIFGIPDNAFIAGFNEKEAFVAELRPALEGMKAVSKDLLKRNITPVVICDNMMAFCMKEGLVSTVHIFYSSMAKMSCVCRTGSMAAALCARAHGVPVYLHPSKKVKAGKPDLTKIGGMRVTNADIKTYVPLTEEVPLELANLKE